MPVVCCPKERKDILRLSTLVVLFKDASSLSNQLDFYTDETRLYGVLPSLKNLGRWGRDCNFDRRIQTSRRPVFAAWLSIEKFSEFSSSHGSLYAFFASRGPAMSAVANSMFRRVLACFAFTSSLRQTFENPFGALLIASSGFSLSSLSWCVHGRKLALAARQLRGFVFEMPAAFSFRCCVAYHLLLTTKLS